MICIPEKAKGDWEPRVDLLPQKQEGSPTPPLKHSPLSKYKQASASAPSLARDSEAESSPSYQGALWIPSATT